MKNHLSAACLAAILLSGVECVDAQGFKIGDRVSCDGATGTIVRTEPRAGWDEPFSIVQIEGAGAGTEYRCLQARMRAAPGLEQLRPRSGENVTRPVKPVVETREDAAIGSTAPDGSYRCHKISPGGQLMDIGDLTVSGGRATVHGMPESWVVRSVSVRGKNDRGQPIVAVDYTSAAGWNDRLDCVEQ